MDVAPGEGHDPGLLGAVRNGAGGASSSVGFVDEGTVGTHAATKLSEKLSLSLSPLVSETKSNTIQVHIVEDE